MCLQIGGGGVYIDGQRVEGLGQGERPLAQFGLGGGVGFGLQLATPLLYLMRIT